MIEPRTLKGFRDFLPTEARKRQYVIETLKKVFESFGFEPLETPVLEYEDVLSGKYGDEGEKLMYRFTDNGGRRVAMRYDQTVPLARVVAQYASVLPLPFKRYQVQPVWRAENTQKGRYREFVQCDIDTVGIDSATADAEIVAIAGKAYESLGFKDYKIIVNDRSVFGDLPARAITIIDKLKKIGEERVQEELEKAGFDKNVLEKVKNATIPSSLKAITEIVAGMGIPRDRIIFEPTLARGLDYYTRIIIEVESESYATGSLGGGGRYDNLLSTFAQRSIPAVGFSFGFDRIIEAMDEENLFPDSLNSNSILVTVFNPEFADKSLAIANLLRGENINTELFLDATSKMEKQLKYADQKNIPYVIIIGPQEAEKDVVALRDMKTREQKVTSIQDVILSIREGTKK
jgi:histidyl-tRNA synthetase